MLGRDEHGGDIYGNPGVMLDFSVNTNPLGMPNEVHQALISQTGDCIRYPDPQCRKLRAAISLHEDVPEGMVLCGNGAADLIYRLCFAIKPRKALLCAPTFSEYERALGQAGCQVAHHVLRPEQQFALTADIEDLLVPGIDILFLCNPNNPTGRLMPEDMLERILRRAGQNGTKIVIDECFLDFTTGCSVKNYLNEMPGLIVIKAFTKIYAMAGLRLGYLLASDRELLNRINDIGQCWSVSVPAQIAGAAALACKGWHDKTRRLVAKERHFLSESLEKLGITVCPSDANFLLLHSEQPLYEPLLDKGILVRSCKNFIGLDALYCRVAVKMHHENTRLMEAINKVLVCKANNDV
jgi:threonine-phosphate decarboxylase